MWFKDPLTEKMAERETEKIYKYQDLAIELQRIRKVKTQVIPVVIGALATMPKTLVQWLDVVGIKAQISDLQ